MRKHVAAALLWLVVAAGLVRASDKTYPTISHDELARAVTARMDDPATASIDSRFIEVLSRSA